MKKAIILILLIAVVLLYYNIKPYEKAEVIRVIDGDTIFATVEGENIKIRFLLVDAKEMSNGGIIAKKFIEKKIKKGDIVFLEKDIKGVDVYGRLLRYVYLKEEDVGDVQRSLNAMLLEKDLAVIKPFFPNYKYLINLYYYTKVK